MESAHPRVSPLCSIRLGRPARAALAIVAIAVLQACDSGGNGRMEDLVYRIPGGDPGIELSVGEKFLPGNLPPGGRGIVILVHGATTPSHIDFDLPLAEYSWMNRLARDGFDVWRFDIRGFGDSTRPREMDDPPERHAPIARAEEAKRDLAAVVDFALATRGAEKVNLVSWSVGSTPVGLYAIAEPQKVERVAFYAPTYGTFSGLALGPPPPAKDLTRVLGAYRYVDAESTIARWEGQIPEEDKSVLIEPAVIETWVKLLLASDPTSGTRNPPSTRAPNGLLADSYLVNMGRSDFDASRIVCPVLIIRGGDDTNSSDSGCRFLVRDLTSSPSRRYVLVPRGTHFLTVEKPREELWSEVSRFLTEP